MELQLTVRLPPELATALERTRRKSGRRTSEIVRTALREYLRLGSGGDAPPAERVRSLIGSLDSGVPQLAEEHRRFVLESLQRAR
ncbi:MAG: ribbon-helix-helix protein, CopG family [Gammaproteobacteria bacterium]|nr:ribbon-helix-helix protein, CopG family [Gammaproteobacteria bacterium]